MAPAFRKRATSVASSFESAAFLRHTLLGLEPALELSQTDGDKAIEAAEPLEARLRTPMPKVRSLHILIVPQGFRPALRHQSSGLEHVTTIGE